MELDGLPPGFTLLQITPRLQAGGVEQATLDTAAAVVRAGGRALVASRGGALEGALSDAGGELVRLPVDAKDPLTLAFNAGRLTRCIRREAVSLVHVRSRAPAFSALIAARATGAPLIATYHGVYAARSALKRWYNGIMTRGDVVIANSNFTRDHVLTQHPAARDRLVVIPEGIDTARFDPAAVAPERVAAMRAAWGLGADDRRVVILLAARWASWKGHRLIVDALTRARRRDNAVLILAGEGQASDRADRVRQVAATAGLADTVRIVGPCADMPAAWLAADLAVAPSTEAESFGRGVAEAGAMGRAVLASRLGAPAETIVPGQTGWLAPAGDIDAWARALDEAIGARPAVRAAMGQAARARITALYSLAGMCEATFRVYRRALESRT